MKKTLCLYYSRTESTRIIMEQIAKDLEGELVEYTDGKKRSGALGYLSACIDSYRKPPQIWPLETKLPLEEYDRVIIGCPVWAEKPCIIVEGLLAQYGDALPEEVYFVVTHSSTKFYDKRIEKLNQYLKSPHRGHLSLSTKKGSAAKAVAEFVEELQ